MVNVSVYLSISDNNQTVNLVCMQCRRHNMTLPYYYVFDQVKVKRSKRCLHFCLYTYACTIFQALSDSWNSKSIVSIQYATTPDLNYIFIFLLYTFYALTQALHFAVYVLQTGMNSNYFKCLEFFLYIHKMCIKNFLKVNFFITWSWILYFFYIVKKQI